MIVMVSGLVEAFQFAERAGIDPAVLRDVLAVSPMASNVSQVKAGKLAARDWTAQAAISDVLRNVDLVREAVAGSGAAAPLIDSCRELYSRSEEHTSELQSLMRNSDAVFCLKKKKKQN